MIGAARIAELLDRPAPTPEQQTVIEADLTPNLVIAGAGSGKTETMAGRVVWLVANGLVQPDQVLGLTFTRKAAGELDQRIRTRLRYLSRVAGNAGIDLPFAETDDLARPTVSTYNAYAGSLVADHGLRIGLEPTSRLLGEAASFQMVSRIVETWPEDLGLDHALSTVTSAVLALSGAADDHLADVADIDVVIGKVLARLDVPLPGPRPAAVRDVVMSLADRRRILPLVQAYRDAKRSISALDYGDQVALAARLARQVPQVCQGERDRFAVVLLDEYQDTSYGQVELLRTLFGAGHPVTAVGDPHQSIYGWRGASAGGLARFPSTFPAVDGTPAVVHSLATSWRNDHAILRVANRTAEPLRLSSPVPVPALTARPDAGEGDASAAVLTTVAEEAEAIAEFIASERERRSTQGLSTTAAVLCRKRAQFDLIAQALREKGLPVHVVGLGGLLTSPEIVDLVSALQMAHDPTRGDAAMRLLTGARIRLGLADLHGLAAWADELAGQLGPDKPDAVDAVSIADAINDPPPPEWSGKRGRRLSDLGRARVRELGRVLGAIRALLHLPLPDLVGYTERLLGLDIEVQAVPGSAPGRARATLDAFANVAASYAASVQTPDLGGFLAWLEAAERREDGLELPVVEPDPEAVQVATVHAAKGLEWDVVAVPGLVDGSFPSPAALRSGGPVDKGWLTALDALPFPARGDRDDLPALDTAGVTTPRGLVQRFDRFTAANGARQIAEERRLAYVAFTRARVSLLLTAAIWGSRATPRQVSPFLVELRDEGLVQISTWAEPAIPGAPSPFTSIVRSAWWPADPFDPDETSKGSRRVPVRSAADAVLEALAAGPDSDPTDPDDALVSRLLAEEAIRRAPAQTTALPPHLAASALVRLADDLSQFAIDLRRPIPTAPSDSTRRGTAFHAWVEAYFGQAVLVDLDALPGADDDLIPVDTVAERLRDGFLATRWANLHPIAVEQDAEVTIAGITVRARIDAVFPDPDSEDPDAVIVIDWKTGGRPRDLAERAAREVQLAVYRLAWVRRTGLRPDQVRAAFCYVASGTTVIPKRLADADELAGLIGSATD